MIHMKPSTYHILELPGPNSNGQQRPAHNSCMVLRHLLLYSTLLSGAPTILSENAHVPLPKWRVFITGT